jgi:hypothetical protein
MTPVTVWETFVAEHPGQSYPVCLADASDQGIGGAGVRHSPLISLQYLTPRRFNLRHYLRHCVPGRSRSGPV